MIRKLIKSLLKAAAYPESTQDVRLVETHVSFIFITDDFVYKVKKPVDFGFLNFTTLDRRRFYCEEEVRLNRRLCPEIYLGVVELRCAPGGAAFGGPGALIDYAVKMKRLPEERMATKLLERGELQPAHLEQLARVIAQFHGSAARGPQIDAQGSVGALRAAWEENFSQAACCIPQALAAADLALVRGWVERFLAEHGETLRARVEGGFLRDCDGDLHLGNICLAGQATPGLPPASRVCIFDCIEFNEKFRFIDTAADIAFLLMDLEYAGRPDLCTPFLEAYREASGDPGLDGVLRFYQAQRAFVRGKVQCLRLGEPGLAPDEARALQLAARRYLRLSRGYCLRDRLPPTLVVTCGPMGSGKSTLARELARELGLSLASSDPVRKELAGREPSQHLFEGWQGGIYAPASTRATYRALLERARRELCLGHSVVVDASFSREADRAEFRALAGKLGVPFVLVLARCDLGVVRERLERREREPGEPSDGRVELLPRQLAEFEAPAPGEALEVDTGGELFAAVDQVLRGMGTLP